MRHLRGFSASFVLILSAALALSAAGCDSASPADTADVPDLPGWTLVWNDEFNGEGVPNAADWTYDTGNSGFGNNELQTYYANNTETARMEGGNLVITTSLVERPNYKEYRSARLKTAGKHAWKYGRIEVRAQLPSGTGTWPAIWMLSQDGAYGGWPRSGEIDIMEHVGYEPNVVHGTVHTQSFNHIQGTQKGDQLSVPTATTGFHTYAIEWFEDRIDFFVDDEKYFTFNNTGNGSNDWPFDQPFFLVLNTAVGGNWGGQRGVDDKAFPTQMLVDYVRVYEKVGG